MMHANRKFVTPGTAFLWVWLTVSAAWAAPPSTRPVDGLRENPVAAFALVGAQVVRSSGQEPSEATVILREGVIEQVARDAPIPEDARRVDLSGKILYPGLIDAYAEVDVNRSSLNAGTSHWNDQITPQISTARSFAPNEKANEALRSQGIVAQIIAPREGILKGQSGLVSTAAAASSRDVISDPVALHVRLTVPFSRSRDQYPNSPMGAVALARQTMLDADWYGRAWQTYLSNPSVPRPEHNEALAALAPFVSGRKLVVIDAQNELFALRADTFAREFGLRAAIRGSGSEYRRLEAIRQTGRTYILPVDFPQPPNVATAENARHVTLEQLMHWYLAPENAARLEQVGVQFAFTSHGLDNPKHFLKGVRRAVARGLSPEKALEALTTVPAELAGAADSLGSIEAGKAAYLIVTDGKLFDTKTKVVSVWIDGREYPVERGALFDVRGTWKLKLQRPLEDSKTWDLELSGTPEKLQGKLVTRPDTTEPVVTAAEGTPPEPDGDSGVAESPEDRGEVALKDLTVSDGRITASFETKSLGQEGRAMLSLVISSPDSQATRLLGYLLLPDGKRVEVTAQHVEEGHSSQSDTESAVKNEEEHDANGSKSEEPDLELNVTVNFPLGAFGRDQEPEQPEWIVFRHATVWTCGPQGVLHNASVLVHRGRIEAVGHDEALDIPSQATEIDCNGTHLSPGIIDCHSHMATDGGVNESSQAITAEVRISDFIDGDDITIYRQLAGGVTASNILHGSANPIGGQNQVIKLRWGGLPQTLKMKQAPPGIKFALGENVKQSNWGERYSTRYPQTRMGVEQIIRDAFHAAEDYERNWEAWERDRRGLPPRRDLELEALLEVVRGERWIHCHSYRQDEILALLRTLEEFDITIGSLQHILEGYKVAPEMAAHGAMGSSFSDWWAYKFEVFDAIPYNGALMHEAGIVVSFNSDDRELGRHLNHEAAKAVKYGGVGEHEALQFVTLNPAKQLRIDGHVGSLEVGKDADLVVWSGSPLSLFSRCEQTWIDGRKYFDRSDDKQERRRVAALRAKLIQAVLRSGETMVRPGEEEVDESDLWPREDLFCVGHDDHGE